MPENPIRDRGFETRLAVCEQKVEDLIFDVRALSPLVVGHAELRGTIEGLSKQVETLANAVKDIDKKIDHESDQRIKGQDERAKELRRSRIALWIAGIGLFGTFVSSTAVVLAALL